MSASGGQALKNDMRSGARSMLTQPAIVAVIAAVCFVAFSLTLSSFGSAGNLVSLLRSVAVLGILAVAMSITVIGRGIDLSVAAIMAVCGAWSMKLIEYGYLEPTAILMGLGLALLVGVINGVLIAYIEIPAILATLATGTLLFGLSQIVLIKATVIDLPQQAAMLKFLGQGAIAGIPMPILSAAAVVALAWLLLNFTRWGWFTYAQGDNEDTARLTGIAIRPLTVAHYVLAALIAFIAGLSLVGSGTVFSTRIADGGILFDVILVVVLGGVSLSGGVGGLGGVVAATILIGILVNGMTIMDLSSQIQNLIKGVVLLAAIVTDSVLHPRDEQTSRQGDI